MIQNEIRKRQQLITIEEALKIRKSVSKGSQEDVFRLQKRKSSEKSISKGSFHRSRPIISKNSLQQPICQRYFKEPTIAHTNKQNFQNNVKKRANITKSYYKISTQGNEQNQPLISQDKVIFRYPTEIGEAQNENIIDVEAVQKSNSQTTANKNRNLKFQMNNINIQIQTETKERAQQRIEVPKRSKKITFKSYLCEEPASKILTQDNEGFEQNRLKESTCQTFNENKKKLQLLNLKEQEIGSNIFDSKIHEQEESYQNFYCIDQIAPRIRGQPQDLKSTKKKQSNIFEQQKKVTICLNESCKNPTIVSKQIRKNPKNLSLSLNNSRKENKISDNSIGPNECDEEEQVSNKIIKREQIEEEEKETNSPLFKPTKTSRTLKTLKTLKSIAIEKSSSNNNVDEQGTLEFKKLGMIGKGSSGVVWKIQFFNYDQPIAMKKISNYNKNCKNEVKIMRELSGHPFIVEFYYANTVHQNKSDGVEIFMQYLADGSLQNKIRMEGTIDFKRVKIYAFQIFRGLQYIHQKGICHRDIKTSNLLTKGNKVVIGDFGSAKKMSQGDNNLSYVGQRSNRAPELVLSSTQYTNKIDIWAAGCCLVEMILGRPLFNSLNSADLFIEIIKLRSYPSEEVLLELDQNAKKKLSNWKLPKITHQQPWNIVLEQIQLDQKLSDLLDKIFEYSPSKRLSAIQVLLHPYFDDIRDFNTYQKFNDKYCLNDELSFFLSDEIDQQTSKIFPNYHQCESFDDQ